MNYEFISSKETETRKGKVKCEIKFGISSEHKTYLPCMTFDETEK